MEYIERTEIPPASSSAHVDGSGTMEKSLLWFSTAHTLPVAVSVPYAPT